MRWRHRLLVTLVGLVPIAAAARAGAVLSAAEKERRDGVVAHVGNEVVKVGELEDRLAAVPRFQLTTFGDSADAIRRKFLDDVVLSDILLAEGAEARHIDREVGTAQALSRARSNAAIRAARAQVGDAAAIPAADVQKYYQDNRAKFETPDRYSVFRILCKTREEAVAVLDAAKKEATVPKFTELARAHSLDKATNMRAGNLGFVALDGTSNEAGLKVDPAIVKAASLVKDGEFVAEPVPEAGGFAVVWHRGTVAATKQTLAQVDSQIRDTLVKERVEQAELKLTDELRAKNVSELNADLLNTIDVSPGDGAIVPRKRPGQVPPLTGSASAPPPR